MTASLRVYKKNLCEIPRSRGILCWKCSSL